MSILEGQKILELARATKRVLLDDTLPKSQHGWKGKLHEPVLETKPEDWVCPDCGMHRTPFWNWRKGKWTLYQGPCETCLAQEFAQQTMQLAQERTLENNRLKDGEYGLMSFETYVPRNPSQVAAMDATLSMVDEWRRGNWTASIILASEDVGIGKTHLAIAAAKTGLFLWPKPGYKILTVWDMPSYVAAIKESYNNGGTAEVQASAAEARILVMDDVGAEHVVSTSWYQSLMYDIFNERWLNQLATVVTTNLPGATLHGRLGTRAASRMFSLTGKPVILTGTDYRLKDMIK